MPIRTGLMDQGPFGAVHVGSRQGELEVGEVAALLAVGEEFVDGLEDGRGGFGDERRGVAIGPPDHKHLFGAFEGVLQLALNP